VIDFPASPTNGQIFNAPNGVAYQYSATYLSWLAQNAAPTGGPFLPLVGGTLAGPGTLVGTTATFSGNVSAKNTATVVGPGGVNSGIVQHDDTHIYVMPTNAGGGTVLGAANANAIIVTTAAVRPVATATWDLGGSAFRWKDYYGTTANFTANVAGPATVLSVANSNTGSTSQNIFQQSVGTRFVNRTIEYTGQYLIENANGLPTRYSDFDTHNYRTTAGAGYAVLNSAGLSLTGGVSATSATFSGTVGVGGAVGSAKFRSSGADGDLLGLFSGTTKGVRITTSASGTTIEGVDNTGITSFQPLNLNGTTVAAPTPAPASNDTSIATTAWVRANISGGGGSGKLLQTVYNRTGTGGTGTTIIPFDTTIPQITEGDEYMTLAVTPTSATSLLIIDVVWIGSNSAVNNMGVALFKDATASALTAAAATVTAANATVNIKFKYIMVSGSTAAMTFRVRAGGGAAGTTSFNSGTTFGFVMCSSMTIQEVTP
jgi:hypothetical protein